MFFWSPRPVGGALFSCLVDLALRTTKRPQLLLRRWRGILRLSGLRAGWFAAGQLGVFRNSFQIRFGKRFRMTGEFLAQTGNLRRGNGTALMSPLLANVSENIGDLRVGQRFVPRL